MNGNASIIVVLCSHICDENCFPLENAEWAKLADMMMTHKLQPTDIPNFSDYDMKQYFGYGTNEIERIKRLLDRAGSLSFELEKLSAMGIKVITRADMDYPKILKTKLRGSCPSLFYFAGNLALLNKKTVGFVGSRSVHDIDTIFTETAVKTVNRNGFGIVSGGAKGIDSIASSSSIANGSFSIEYISDSFLRKIRDKNVISAMQNGNLLLMSIAKPDAGFNVGMAMQRNKLIYAQSEATVVIKSDYNKGGTWSGAIEALKKRYCPVLCRDYKEYRGNSELIRLGAIPIDEKWDGAVNDITCLSSNFKGQLSFFDE